MSSSITVTITPTGDHPSFPGFLAHPSQGSGPGIIFISENLDITEKIEQQAEQVSQEGYVVLVPDLSAISPEDKDAILYIKSAISYLNTVPKKTGKIGIIGRGHGGYVALSLAESFSKLVDCAIVYYPTNLNDHKLVNNVSTIRIPFVIHLVASNDDKPIYDKLKEAGDSNKFVEIYEYPDVKYGFALQLTVDKAAAEMAYSRSLNVLKKTIGPLYNLEALWNKHLEYEFEIKDPQKSVETMVSVPYVNHIPTMTGGVGYEHVFRFYKFHFINSNPPDTRIIPISRTIGMDRIVDEMLFSFTHTQRIDWLLPGISPTNKFVEIPLVAIVNFRGDKICHEHIYWDQASVLVQIGLLNKEGLPITGVEQAKKVLNNSISSNQLINDWDETLKKEI